VFPTLAHLHLLLNHWPIIGTFIAGGLLIVALLAKSDDMEQVTFGLFSLIALLAIPAYLTGRLAQDVIQQEQGVSLPLIEAHAGAALLALTALQVTGGFAWAALWQFRRRSRPARWIVWTILGCSVVTIGLMTVAGNTGGAIRHPEILSAERTASLVGGLGARLDAWIQYIVTGSTRWIWPLVETFHFIGLTLLLGTTGVLNLRLLGFLKVLPAGPLHRLIPWGVAGLAINVVTGMLFFIGMPFFYVYNLDFHLKILAMLLAGATLLLQSTKAFRSCDHLEAGQDAPTTAKVFAAASLVLWTVVVVLGRYMPLFEDTLDPRF
jgi:uncharacterized membrane protein